MITFKFARDCSAEGNTYDIMESRRSYAFWVMSPAIINMRKILVDEFGMNVHDFDQHQEEIECTEK